MQSAVYNTGTPAIAFAEVPDTVALLAWAFKDALIARLDAEIDAEADDAAAFTHEQRQQREAEAQGDLLAIERDESWLVWSAMSQNRTQSRHQPGRIAWHAARDGSSGQPVTGNVTAACDHVVGMRR